MIPRSWFNEYFSESDRCQLRRQSSGSSLFSIPSTNFCTDTRDHCMAQRFARQSQNLTVVANQTCTLGVYLIADIC
ncbi:hypothetical protein KLVA_26160 [Klebsiella variicola]|nr:hypothetical protein KLVA_26160 [Klebsiella variicola]GKK14272.1 hypothetical protein NUKP38_27130 [Klebsiella variicola]